MLYFFQYTKKCHIHANSILLHILLKKAYTIISKWNITQVPATKIITQIDNIMSYMLHWAMKKGIITILGLKRVDGINDLRYVYNTRILKLPFYCFILSITYPRTYICKIINIFYFQILKNHIIPQQNYPYPLIYNML